MGAVTARGWLATVAVLAAVAAPAVARRLEARALADRIQAVAGRDASCAVPSIAIAPGVGRAEPLLASWQAVGGCGAGASTGGGGVKWVGRNVTGGLIHVECQGNYIKLSNGYDYVATTLVTGTIGSDWNLGISVPYLYKYTNDPYDMKIDVSNQGLGDVSALLGRKFGDIGNWTGTLTLGAPTGTHKAMFRTQMLPQERQLGHGRVTGSLMLDHTRDTDWGITVLGGTVNYRGGQNDQQSYRAPSASLYSYAGYVLGPFTPSAGLILTGLAGHDRNAGTVQGTPVLSVAGNVSLEWATDWVAILLGASLPYDYVGRFGNFQGGHGFGPWVVALGVAVAPF